MAHPTNYFHRDISNPQRSSECQDQWTLLGWSLIYLEDQVQTFRKDSVYTLYHQRSFFSLSSFKQALCIFQPL